MARSVIGREQHDPNAVLDYTIDWSGYLTEGDTIADSAWSATPTSPSALTVGASEFTDTTATVRISGGTSGTTYYLTNRVTLASGQIDDRSIALICTER